MISADSYCTADSEDWDAFLEQRARNATFLHSRRFFDHNPANAEDDASLIFRSHGRITGVFPACLIRRGAAASLESHPRSTYGGFIISGDCGIREVLEMVDGAIAAARARQASTIVVRNPFRIFHLGPSDEVDYALWLRGFQVSARELEVAIPLRAVAPDDVLARFDSKTRNQVRKAERSGVVVRESDDYAAFWRLLEDNLAAKHHARPTHTLAEFETLRSLVGGDRIRLFAAEHDGRMVAGMVVFAANRRALHAQYIASAPDALHLCPVNAVVHAVARWGATLGVDYLNLGMSTEDSGRRPNFGLFAFKEGFGGRGVLRETMSLQLKDPPQALSS